MVSAFVSRSSGPVSSAGREHCVVFMGKALFSHYGLASHPGEGKALFSHYGLASHPGEGKALFSHYGLASHPREGGE